MNEQLNGHSLFIFTFRDPQGNIYYEDKNHNLIPTEGKNYLLDKTFSGSAYTATWYMGLISSVSYTAFAAGDTAAQINGTNGWKEAGLANAPTYSTTRPTMSFSSASSATKTASGVVFTFTGGGTVKGGFVVSTSSVDGTTGVIYSEGLLSAGDRTVANGDTLTVTWSTSL